MTLDLSKLENNLNSIPTSLSDDLNKLDDLKKESEKNPHLKNNNTYQKFLLNVETNLKELDNEDLN